MSRGVLFFSDVFSVVPTVVQELLSLEIITVYLILSPFASVEAVQEKVVIVSTPVPVGLRPDGLVGGMLGAGSLVMVK